MQNTLVQATATLPEGAHIYTALACLHRGTGQVNKEISRRKLFGTRANSLVNWFGIGVGHMSREFFGGYLSPREILAKHTLFGYYSLGLSVKRASEWEASLSRGDYARPTRYIRNAGAAIVSESLRWCPVCAQDDIEVHGYATWKVVHQLPCISVCPSHGNVLLSRCEYCDHPNDDGRVVRLPSEPCSQCGRLQFNTVFKSARPAVVDFARLCGHSVDTQDSVFRPEHWVHLMRVAQMHLGSPQKVLEVVRTKLLDLWGVGSLEEIGSELRISCRSNFLVQVIHGHLTASPLAIQMLVLQVLEAEFPEIRTQAECVVEAQSLDVAMALGDSSAKDERAHIHSARQFGVCDQLAMARSEFSKLARVADDLGISRQHALKLANRIESAVRSDKESGAPSLDASVSRREKKENMRREKYRSQVQGVLVMEPTINRTGMWHRCKTAVLWLSKHDRAWLDRAVPVIHAGTPYAERPSTRRLGE